MNNLGARYSKAVLCSLIVSVNVGVQAQTLRHPAIGLQRQTGVEPVHSNVAANATATGANKATAAGQNKVTTRVASWFAKYDEIRRRAQMPPQEKQNAHKLLKAALIGDQQEKKEAKEIVQKMVVRYDNAVTSLSSLPSPPETARLHQGYMQYFRTGHNFFQRYLQTLKQDHPPDPSLLPQLQSAKRQLAVMDVSNKMLDHRLRKEFNIPAYRYE